MNLFKHVFNKIRLLISKKQKEAEKEIHPILIADDYIQFPKGYYFRYSLVNDKKRISAERMNGFLLNTFPISFIIDHKELIFLGNISKERIVPFCEKNKIPILDLDDVWERINRPYLDTSFDEDEITENDLKIFEHGIGPEELIQIRKKINMAMSKNYFAWEWVYLGLFDYLSWAWLTHTKYWWAMEIALRKYNNDLNKK